MILTMGTQNSDPQARKCQITLTRWTREARDVRTVTVASLDRLQAQSKWEISVYRRDVAFTRGMNNGSGPNRRKR